ncbi:glycosyltransferase family 9 protein [Rubellicoccus peritrichatus]|uniref:Glycosyltransferase family 9 protein n=1 Tax=Rubellicoccus peritrichatus TaxID=3080537 RepID=A0AAQ3L674_9BACT|nr:glycosyltransferase family 9 protein [Puniceicoccus sp. CR14]WOO39681.1 glycosyltransferase family 9 protein [Puniceicoccus sp. CR14]
MASKILAIKFKYLGDVVVMVPALRALRAQYPDAELHVLVAEEAAPLISGLGWIDRIWGLPRSRGEARIFETMPMIKQLRAEKFDRSVDFVGNDRGALLSRLIGAKERLGVHPQRGSRTRRVCYTETIEELDTTRHETIRDFYVLTPWETPAPAHWELELALANKESKVENDTAKSPIICHLSTSQRKKELPVQLWAQVGQRLTAAGHDVFFSSGPSDREWQLLQDLRKVDPDAEIIGKSDSLIAFAKTLSQAKLFISPDTAPLHIAAGLGVPTLGLFGPTSPERWSPPGKQHRTLKGGFCICSGHLETCAQASRCIDTISSELVTETALTMLQANV